MLENYTIRSDAERDRISALQAALEIAKASVAATTNREHSDKVADDLKYVAKEISALTDAIQAAAAK